MEAELLSAGVELTLVGMATVLFFLTALIAAITLMSRIVARLNPEGGSSADEEEIAAISAAISRYRRER